MTNIEHLVDLKEKFLELNEDQETTKFIQDCQEKSEWFITQLFHSIMLSLLKWVMAITSVNGYVFVKILILFLNLKINKKI